MFVVIRVSLIHCIGGVGVDRAAFEVAAIILRCRWEALCCLLGLRDQRCLQPCLKNAHSYRKAPSVRF